ncbi:RNA polymerase RpoN-/SigL-like sigma 54 subunit [Rhodopseudomonas thermotolerans]|uniref:RNA polymerase RpoN-/SigL-like sigma 54 subunit n=3 Tax=Nitrobacteraceae TaxID=41294 RepID=A0A336JVZ1_9BRAD|nr:RNA polymerase RpoN-/SigL-like sigma 54 subunit [Rhodopseudomonas pentothenatexigens]REF91513.1 RNA polymerase RpoN-/SigL-like sigma 54 subunit [Rhodopseudomonas thermotolerans]SSW92536.1 RNA polymerase RpoN-/SigL-like sigma 54 subunit [Rhodopseudomonas pentothenatexigens]
MSVAVHRQDAPANAGMVLSKATIRAADRLGLSQKILGNVIGLSESVISRMRSGDYVLERGKPFELATLFVRLYRSLDAIVGGDEASARAWMRGDNLALRGTPAELIQKVQGLLHVVQYLDSRRAPI